LSVLPACSPRGVAPLDANLTRSGWKLFPEGEIVGQRTTVQNRRNDWNDAVAYDTIGPNCALAETPERAWGR